ncbi:MAG: hypothetical protein ABI672_00040 [Vicinamibacteria bacterium]
MDAFKIAAHVENGVIHLDAPLPPQVERVEVVAYAPASPRKSMSEYIRNMPKGTRTGAEISAELKEERDSWER